MIIEISQGETSKIIFDEIFFLEMFLLIFSPCHEVLKRMTCKRTLVLPLDLTQETFSRIFPLKMTNESHNNLRRLVEHQKGFLTFLLDFLRLYFKL